MQILLGNNHFPNQVKKKKKKKKKKTNLHLDTMGSFVLECCDIYVFFYFYITFSGINIICKGQVVITNLLLHVPH